jgi:hypothetical protein
MTLYPGVTETRIMLVERGIQVMNVEVVGDAYAIASNYLRKTGAIPDTFATDERLIEIIVQMFQRGEYNKIRLANKAIVKFEAETFIAWPLPEKIMEAAIDRIMHTYDLLLNRTSAASAEARAKVTDYVKTLFEAGEKDTHRLTVCGLTYLRQLDGSTDSVKAGFTGM